MTDSRFEVFFFGVLSVLVIIINSFVCLLVFTNTRLRTYTNCFVVSLAASDFITGITHFCIYLLQLKMRIFFNITYALSCFGGITTLCGVTWDRYVAVMNPLKYHDLVPTYFKAVIVTSWSITVVVACIPLTWVLNSAGSGIHLLIHKIYQFATVGLGIILPYIIIMWAQFRIYQKAKKCLHNDLKQESFCNRQRKKLRRLFLEAKVARVFIIAASMFFISWFPMTFYTLAFAMGQPQIVPRVLMYDIAPAFISLRSLINPMIYSFMKLDFTDALKRLLKMQRHRITRRFSSMQDSKVTASVRLSTSSNASVGLCDRRYPALMMETSC